MSVIRLIYSAEVTECSPKIQISTRHCDSTSIYQVQEGNSNEITSELEVGPVDQLRIKFFDKAHSNNGETWLNIDDIFIDNINIQHVIFKGKQWPLYDENFYNEFSPPDYYSPGAKFFHNGVFELNITTPIWKWLLGSYINYA